MFGNLAHIIPPTLSSQADGGPPREVQPPTPIHFPQCRPGHGHSRPGGTQQQRRQQPEAASGPKEPATPHLTTLLQGLVRPADQVRISHLEALGVCVIPDAPLEDVVPSRDAADWSFPPFDQWDKLSREETIDYMRGDGESRPKLCNGKVVPGPTKYVDLRQGLLTDNDRAFRAVRRVTPKPGEQYVRLGYCHDFFRNLEALTNYWDDTSREVPSSSTTATEHESTITTSSTPKKDGEKKNDPVTDEKPPAVEQGEKSISFDRACSGSSMPDLFRTQLLTSFLKLVTYDFNCSIMTRSEPRLTLRSSLPPSSPHHRRSQFSSGCTFIYRMPLDRDSAKKGIVEGPIAAVSPRHTTSFPPLAKEREEVIDLAREVIAALITAQHRAREGRTEVRIGKDKWWTTQRRWGGGPGGPIGKEVEILEAKAKGSDSTVIVGDKDEPPSQAVEGEGPPSSPSIPSSSTTTTTITPPARSSRLSGSSSRSRFIRSSNSALPASPSPSKRPRTSGTLPIYDAYRMVRPPSRTWDSKTRHEAIGRQRGVDYDDVFVISCLFHHVAILRVRVPDRLLEVLDGAPAGEKEWGKVEVWRTKWFDFFGKEDRVEAMRGVWAVMAYAMRDVVREKEDGQTVQPQTGSNGAGEAAQQQSGMMDVDQ